MVQVPIHMPKDGRTLMLRMLRDAPAGVLVLFALAAFVPGYVGSGYSTRASSIEAHAGPGIYCVQNCNGAYESWYRHNQEAAGYSGHVLRLLVFGFPTAMTLAAILAMSFGWLPGVSIPQLVPTVLLLYCGSVATAGLATLSLAFSLSLIGFPLGLTFGLLAVVVYFYAPVFASAVLAGRDPSIRGESGRIFLVSLLSIPLGLVIGEVLHSLLPMFTPTYGIQVAMGAFFGASIARPRVSRPLPPVPARPVTSFRPTIEHLVLALGAQIAVSTITIFQRASRPIMPLDSGLDLLVPFILTQLPFLILICLLLTRPDRRAFTFLIATLAFGVVDTFFNPMVARSYRQIYLDHSIGLMWPIFCGLIYIITGVLAYMVIQKTDLRPKVWPAIFGTFGMFGYFIFIEQATPYLNSVWK